MRAILPFLTFFFGSGVFSELEEEAERLGEWQGSSPKEPGGTFFFSFFFRAEMALHRLYIGHRRRHLCCTGTDVPVPKATASGREVFDDAVTY